MGELEKAAKAIEGAWTSPEDRKVYIYGCGSTGRLAKQIESETWKQYWRRIKERHSGTALWDKVKTLVGENISDKVIGELTGGDRALVNALEGFEDLQIIGQLQLEENHVSKGDIVISVTEGGETSSVIGTIMAALRQYGEDTTGASDRLYFIYNNPSEVLMPFERSRMVIENPKITKI